MIELTDKLYLDADECQYILKEKKTFGKNSKKQGETYFREICYHSKLNYMCDSILEYMTRKAVRENEGTLNDLVKIIQETSLHMLETFRKVD